MDLRQQKRLIKESSSYELAYEDVEFLQLDELRPVRLQLELLKPELVMERENIDSTIVVFGSARIPSRAEAERELVKAEERAASNPRDKSLQHELIRAKTMLANSKYYEQAREFGRIVSRECQLDGRCNFVIVTGGGPGIMEAANRGAAEAEAKSIGLNITLPHEQQPNPYITPELCFQFRYFALRKLHFLLRARALVVFPGGFGTLDELFETLTLIQTEKSDRIPVLLFGEKYWRRLVDFDYLVDQGTISPEDLNLFSFVDSPQQAWDLIRTFHVRQPLAKPSTDTK
jgi:uncharacterized protein (TIGR00730 family)